MKTEYAMKQGNQPYKQITKSYYDYTLYYLRLQGSEKVKEIRNESPNLITNLIEMIWNGQRFSLLEKIYKKQLI